MMFSLGRKGLLSAAANAAASMLDLISFAIVARILSPQELGLFLIALSVGILVERIGSPNLAQTFMRHIARAIAQHEVGDLRRILGLALKADASLLFFSLVAGLATATLIAPKGNATAYAAIVLTVMIQPLRPPLLAVAVPRAFDRHEAVTAALMFGALFKVAILGIVLAAHRDLVGIVAAFVAWRIISGGAGLVIGFAQAKRHGAFDSEPSGREEFSSRHADFGPFVRIGAFGVVPQVVVEFATLLIAALSGAAVAGIYRLAAKVGEAARIYANPIGFVLYSDQCRSVEQGDYRHLMTQTVVGSTILGCVTAAGAMIFAAADQFLVELALGSGYTMAVPAIAWCVYAAVPFSIAVPLQFGLYALGAANRVLQAETIGAMLFVIIIVTLKSPTAEQAAVALAASRFAALLAFIVLFLSELQRKKDHPIAPKP